ncbi:hypothetical protein HWV62_15835 [Athelia sp. TMB]|nr:hypothetical protein HWV62_15835 [Athelia sp. TMB]
MAVVKKPTLAPQITGPTKHAVAFDAQLASQSPPVSKISRRIISSAVPMHVPHPFQSGRLVIQSKILAQDSTPEEDQEQSMLAPPQSQIFAHDSAPDEDWEPPDSTPEEGREQPMPAPPQSTTLAHDATPDEDWEQSMLAESAIPIAMNNNGAQAEVPDDSRLESTTLSPPKAMVMARLCLNKRDKSRRFLRLSSGQSFLHLSMHGLIDKVHLSQLRYSSHTRVSACLPNGGLENIALPLPFFRVVTNKWMTHAFWKHSITSFSSWGTPARMTRYLW